MTCCYKGCTKPITTASLLCAEHSLTPEGQLVDKAAAMLMEQLVHKMRAEIVVSTFDAFEYVADKERRNLNELRALTNALGRQADPAIPPESLN